MKYKVGQKVLISHIGNCLSERSIANDGWVAFNIISVHDVSKSRHHYTLLISDKKWSGAWLITEDRAERFNISPTYIGQLGWNIDESAIIGLVPKPKCLLCRSHKK